jgi:hypothetical protein
MTKREIKKALKGIIEDDDFEECEDYDGNKLKSCYLGSFMSLDPCGRYHHILSPNGITAKCVRFWDNLEKCAEELDGWIESGEGDPTDIYFVMNGEQP